MASAALASRRPKVADLPASACRPAELRRALENAALPVASADPYAQGFGLISAPETVEYAAEHPTPARYR